MPEGSTIDSSVRSTVSSRPTMQPVTASITKAENTNVESPYHDGETSISRCGTEVGGPAGRPSY